MKLATVTKRAAARIGLMAMALFVASACASDERRLTAPDHVFVFLRPSPSIELTPQQSRELGAGHQANIRRLGAERILVFAGPTADGGGVFLLRADSLTEARAILQSDPAVVAGAFDPDAFPVTIHNGHTCAVPEPATMMQRDIVSGAHMQAPAALADVLGLNGGDLLMVSTEGRFVVIFDGPAVADRRDTVRRRAEATGMDLSVVGEVYSHQGILCELTS